MLVVEAMRTVATQNMRSHLGHIPKSYRGEFTFGSNRQWELPFMLSLRSIKQEILRIKASSSNGVNAQDRINLQFTELACLTESQQENDR